MFQSPHLVAPDFITPHFMAPHLINKSTVFPLMYEQHATIKNDNRWIMSSREIRSLIVSALIFLVVFAWVDVLATAYRNRYLPPLRPVDELALAPFYKIRSPHEIPSELRAKTQELTVGRKIGYASLLSLITVGFYLLLSLPLSPPLSQVKVDPVRSTLHGVNPDVLDRGLF